MAVKIGVPRGLFYYKFHPLWKTFFEELGAEITVSPPTTKKILDNGAKCCVDEACLPVKVLHGHVMELMGKVDYIFLPRFTSISRGEYVCPKFGGLPDMVRNTLKGLPPLIDTEINMRRDAGQAEKAAEEAGSILCGDRRRIKRAYKIALREYEKFSAQVKAGANPQELLEGVNSPQPACGCTCDIKLAVLGHSYNLYDRHVSMDLLRKLSGLGVAAVTLDMLETAEADAKAAQLRKRLFWYYGRKAVGGALCLAAEKDIDGVIYVMSFGCGVDSFVCDMIERRLRRQGELPFMLLTLDEHSGEAGLDTRIEAFVDLIRRKKQLADSLPRIMRMADHAGAGPGINRIRRTE